MPSEKLMGAMSIQRTTQDTAKIAGARQSHGERKAHCDRSVNRIAAAFKNIKADLGGLYLLRGDHRLAAQNGQGARPAAGNRSRRINDGLRLREKSLRWRNDNARGKRESAKQRKNHSVNCPSVHARAIRRPCNRRARRDAAPE